MYALLLGGPRVVLSKVLRRVTRVITDIGVLQFRLQQPLKLQVTSSRHCWKASSPRDSTTPLTKEYTLNHIRDPTTISDIFLN